PARSPSRSASTSKRRPAGAARSASVSACPLPRAGSRSTRAPASSAAAAVPSLEPSSATITSAFSNAARRASTVRAIIASSSRAATRTAAISATRGCLERWQHAVPGARLDPVVAGLGAVQEQGEREPADLLVDVVDAGDPVSLERRDRGFVRVRRLDTDDRHRRRDQARIETGEEAGGSVVLLTGCPDDDDPVGRTLLAPRSLGD